MTQKLFRLKVEGIVGAFNLIQNKWPTHVISLVDPDVALPVVHGNHLVLNLHDVDEQKKPHWILPNESHISKILEFSKSITPADSLLVHCHQGISRSTSTAIGVLIHHGLSPKEALDIVVGVRPQTIPNKLISRMFDETLILGGELIRLVDIRREEQYTKNNGPYIDNRLLDHQTDKELEDVILKFTKL